MNVLEYGDPSASAVLVQMVDEHDLGSIEHEAALIRENMNGAFRMIACKTDNWNTDLSPWKAAPVFGKDAFGGRAAETLAEVSRYCTDRDKTYFIGGYSLAGLFALWAAYQTNVFTGVAAASPSVWFPGFTEYMDTHEIRTRAVYLSLGDKEEKTRNPLMATVGDRIREAHERLKGQGIPCALEWNRGSHFKDADKRTAQAFIWVMTEYIRQQKEVFKK